MAENENVSMAVRDPSPEALELAKKIWYAARYIGTADSLDIRSAAFLLDEFAQPERPKTVPCIHGITGPCSKCAMASGIYDSGNMSALPDAPKPPETASDARELADQIEADVVMRFRLLLNKLNIHGYYNEQAKEFDKPNKYAALIESALAAERKHIAEMALKRGVMMGNAGCGQESVTIPAIEQFLAELERGRTQK